MTRTTRTPGRRTARSLALLVSATAAATATSFALGLAPQAASADPGDTYVRIGTSQLLQSEDLAAIQVPLDAERVTLNRDQDFSPCLGEGNRWTQVLRGAPRPINAQWSRRGHDGQGLTEYIAQAGTAAQAKRYSDTLIRQEIRRCRAGSSPFDFHYGPSRQSRVGDGTATWALSYTGDEPNADGGVVVIRKGTNFGVVYVNGTFGAADQTLESVAKESVDRLVLSR